MPSLLRAFLGEFGDNVCCLGLSNIESLHTLLPKPGLLSGFLGESGSSLGSLLVVTQDIDEDAHRCMF
jgi:hypothetical protein